MKKAKDKTEETPKAPERDSKPLESPPLQIDQPTTLEELHRQTVVESPFLGYNF